MNCTGMSQLTLSFKKKNYGLLDEFRLYIEYTVVGICKLICVFSTRSTSTTIDSSWVKTGNVHVYTYRIVVLVLVMY